LFYALFAGLWILFSDRILALIVSDASRLTQLQTFKGVGFVAVTSLLLFVLLRGELRMRSKAERERFQLQIKEQLALSRVEQEHERYQDLFEVNPMPMWVYDIETLAFLAVNEAAIEHYGYAREEFLGMTIKDIHISPQIPSLVDAVQNIPGVLRKPGIWRHLKKDGHLLEVEITTHDLIFNGRRARLVLANDVTEKLRIETLLKEANETLQAVVQASPLAIVAMDLAGKVRMWNPAASRIFGWSESDVLGQVVPFVPPEKQEEFHQLLELLSKGESIAGMETRRLRKDGSQMDVSISAAPLRDARGEITGFMAVIAYLRD
jgi:PAS domain S-box-containing protein